jgi:DNA-binding GntR family transcriptional regulator
MLETRHHQTARQFVVATLRAEILGGLHPPDTRLRQEEVAARLGVSTTPVREAFRDLLAEGLIGLDAHRGALVRGLTLADVREIYRMRVALEPLLAREALLHAGPDGFADAAALHRLLCDERDPARWAALNVRFHAALMAAAPDGRLMRTVTTLAEAAGAYVSLSMHATPELMALNNRDHAALLGHFERGEVEGAMRRTAAHLTQTLDAIEREAAGIAGAP